jgi:hypothetical protein
VHKCNLYQRINAIPFFFHVSFFGRGLGRAWFLLPAGVLMGDVLFLVEDWCDHGPGECVLDLFSCKRGFVYQCRLTLAVYLLMFYVLSGMTPSRLPRKSDALILTSALVGGG